MGWNLELISSDVFSEIPASDRSATLDCNDVTSVIAFLAFLFVLNMQVGSHWWRPGHVTTVLTSHWLLTC